MMITLLWQIYFAWSLASFCGVLYTFKLDTTGEYIETVTNTPSDIFTNGLSTWIKILSMIITCLLWPLSLMYKYIRYNEYNEITKRIKNNEYCSIIRYYGKLTTWTIFLLELIIIYLTKYL